jgi:dolichyl-phosphate beta-glucosyltransferase
MHPQAPEGNLTLVNVPDLAVVIPAYNEALRIEATLREIASYLRASPWNWEIRVVDDGSADGTANIVAAVAREERRITLQREPHRGKGGAVRAGLRAANASHRFLCDADLSMPIAEIRRFMPPGLGDAQVAIGSREGAGARRVGEPWLRHIAGRGFNTIVRMMMDEDIQDTQCGFKMFTAAAVETIFPHVRVEGWAFDIEVLYVAKLHGLRILEVPIEWHYRADSRLRMGRDGLGMLRELAAIRRRAKDGAYGVPAL